GKACEPRALNFGMFPPFSPLTCFSLGLRVRTGEEPAGKCSPPDSDPFSDDDFCKNLTCCLYDLGLTGQVLHACGHGPATSSLKVAANANYRFAFQTMQSATRCIAAVHMML